MTYWIIPSNEYTFRLIDCLRETDVVDWRQGRYRYNVGDIIYMYSSWPQQRIISKMVVERINVPSSEYINDRKFWANIHEGERALEENKFIRLRLLKIASEGARLGIEDLKKHGLPGPPQSSKIVYEVAEKELFEYLQEQFDSISFLEQGLDDDDSGFQQQIQDEEVSAGQVEADTSMHKPKFTVNNGSRVVERNSRYSKMALVEAEYKCICDARHITFQTPKGVPYMEGHHLIPCTASNTETYWNRFRRNIDCVENIVCLCPNCHRRIHFGADTEKFEVIKDLYEVQATKLKSIGIRITLDELLKLYK